MAPSSMPSTACWRPWTLDVPLRHAHALVLASPHLAVFVRGFARGRWRCAALFAACHCTCPARRGEGGEGEKQHASRNVSSPVLGGRF